MLLETQTLFILRPIRNTAMRLMVKVKIQHNRSEGPEGGRGIALLFLDLGARRGWVVSNEINGENAIL
jgi:hypothetical protein